METKSLHKLIVLAIAVLLIALALPAAVLALQTFTSGGVSTSTGSGGGTTQTFSLGSGFMFSMTTVNQEDAASLQSSGVRVINVPAGTTVNIAATSGQPPEVTTGTAAPTNMIVFGPNGFVGAGAFAGTIASPIGPGVGVGVQVPGAGAGAGAGAGGAGAGAGAGTTIGGTGTGSGSISTPSGNIQTFWFTGSPGQTYLITQQSGATLERVLVVFQ